MRSFSMGITCGKAVSERVTNAGATPGLPTQESNTTPQPAYKLQVLPVVFNHSSTACAQALSTNFTLLLHLLYTLSTGPIRNRNYRNEY